MIQKKYLTADLNIYLILIFVIYMSFHLDRIIFFKSKIELKFKKILYQMLSIHQRKLVVVNLLKQVVNLKSQFPRFNGLLKFYKRKDWLDCIAGYKTK